MSAPLLLSWLAVSVAVSALVMVAALAAQRLSIGALPARGIWATAMIAMLGVTFTQPLRRAPAIERREGPPIGALKSTTVDVAPPSVLETLLATVLVAPRAAVDQLGERAAAAGRALPPPLARGVLLLWPATTLFMAAVFVSSYRRHRALLRRTRRLEIAGTVVQVSERTGPAVIGATAPTIVIPAWLLERSAEEQRLVIEHERAHIAAYDPQLLLAGCAIVALMPWNPAVWIALARLRLAIEIDCDARVLARGTNPRQYGQLLIELSAAAPSSAIPLGAPAFSYRPSHLERRLRTMTARPARFLAARRTASLVVGTGALLAACGAELPTATELQGMDVAKVESRYSEVVKIDSVTTKYLVNGKLVAANLARGIAADSIATIEVRKSGSKANEIRIVTKGAPISGGIKEVAVANVTGKSEPVVVVRGQPMEERRVPGFVVRSDSGRAEPMFLIDGKKATKADLDKLSPSAIEGVEIVKGATALAVFGPDGANGVVRITLKK